MKIPEGEKVVLLESGETGIVKYYDGATVFIDVDGEEVQAHKNDIERVSTFGGSVKKEESKASNVSIQNTGLQLQAFAIRDMKGSITRYDFNLLNNTNNSFSYDYAFYINGERYHHAKGKIDSGGINRLNEFKTDYLNDGPVCQFTLQKWAGGEKEKNIIEKEIRIKTKQFFTRTQSQEFLKEGYFLMEVWNDIPPKKTDWPQVPDTAFDFEKRNIVKQNEVELKAAMPDFIDLHMESLMPGARFSDTSEILHHQIRQFKGFLEKAIRYNLHKIYVVHGLGKGVLKAEIEKVLKEYPEVDRYNNDYHARFGFGATEIFLD